MLIKEVCKNRGFGYAACQDMGQRTCPRSVSVHQQDALSLSTRTDDRQQNGRTGVFRRRNRESAPFHIISKMNPDFPRGHLVPGAVYLPSWKSFA